VRDGWEKLTELGLDFGQVEELIRLGLPGRKVLGFLAVEGGLVNGNFRVSLEGEPADVLLRIYRRGYLAAEVEFALSRLISGEIPAARFYHFSIENPVNGLPFAICEWMPGVPLGKAEGDFAAIGLSVGQVLAKIHSFRFPATGFFDADLKIQQPVGADGAMLQDFVGHSLRTGLAGQRLDSDLASKLVKFVAREGDLLDGHPATPCLSHSDFNASNVLVVDSSVSAVLDWEFAWAGSPYFDLGNLMRPPLGERPGFGEAVAAGYRSARGFLPDDWQRRARVADLLSWVDFLNRPKAGPVLVADATRVIWGTVSVDKPLGGG
jgi:aminoglycoside phosphotransferase (APT) family kinase protein